MLVTEDLGRGPKAAVGENRLSHILVGCADLNASLRLWHECFGLPILEERIGADAATSSVLGVRPRSIKRQAFVGNRWPTGRIHLVEFHLPGRVIREGLRSTDVVLKNLDVLTSSIERSCRTDLPLAVPELKVTYKWHRLPNEDPAFHVKIFHMTGHDKINVGIEEIVGDPSHGFGVFRGGAEHFSPKGYSNLNMHSLVSLDPELDCHFFCDMLGLFICNHEVLGGPEIEKSIGLDPGDTVRIRLIGSPTDPLGRIAMLYYETKRPQANLYPKTKAPNLGSIRVVFETFEFDALRTRLTRAGYEVSAPRSFPPTKEFAPLYIGRSGGRSMLTHTKGTGIPVELFERTVSKTAASHLKRNARPTACGGNKRQKCGALQIIK